MTLKDVIAVSSGSIIIENYNEDTGNSEIIAESDGNGVFDDYFKATLEMIKDLEVIDIYAANGSSALNIVITGW